MSFPIWAKTSCHPLRKCISRRIAGGLTEAIYGGGIYLKTPPPSSSIIGFLWVHATSREEALTSLDTGNDHLYCCIGILLFHDTVTSQEERSSSNASSPADLFHIWVREPSSTPWNFNPSVPCTSGVGGLPSSWQCGIAR